MTRFSSQVIYKIGPKANLRVLARLLPLRPRRHGAGREGVRANARARRLLASSSNLTATKEQKMTNPAQSDYMGFHMGKGNKLRQPRNARSLSPVFQAK